MSADLAYVRGRSGKAHTLLRVGLVIFTLLSVFLAPWWLTYILILGCIVFAAMYEMLILSVILESAYVAGTLFASDDSYPFTAIALCVSACAWFVRRRLLLGDVLP